jgi:hypothetical protein
MSQIHPGRQKGVKDWTEEFCGRQVPPVILPVPASTSATGAMTATTATTAGATLTVVVRTAATADPTFG